jgi:hypothetical protein
MPDGAVKKIISSRYERTQRTVTIAGSDGARFYQKEKKDTAFERSAFFLLEALLVF